MDKEGMVAVVRGTKNSGLCVTLLDGARQYTLQPNTVTQPFYTTNQASQAAAPNQYAVDTSAQAVDGRYASVYKTVHCNMVPTSPTMDVSEFPPQRVALSKGHGNFQVGGLGSGETNFYPSRVTDSFRGGLTWPERGSVFSPRPSVEPDPFASSLRKYPSMSAERSTEIVERLINYAQFKNLKTQRLQSLRSDISTRPRRTLEADIRTDESPTRERSRRHDENLLMDKYERFRRDDDRYRKYEEGDRKFDRSYDVRNFRDISRRGRESAKSPTHPTIRERLAPEEKREPFGVQISIDTQVDFPRISSKEVATVPKMIPPVRNVAIEMSPVPSIASLSTDIKTSKSIQTLKTPENKLVPRKSVQTCFSSIDITSKKIKNKRKSKSQEMFRDEEQDEVLHLVQDLTGPEDTSLLLDDLVKKLKKIYKADKSDRIKIKFGRCVRDQLYSDIDLKDFTRELSNQLLSKIKKNNVLHCNSTKYRAEIQSHGDNNGENNNCVDDIINEWLRDIPIKNRDYLGKSIKKDHLLLTIGSKIKNIVVSKLKLDCIDKSLKADIIQLIEDIPIAVCGCDKRLYLNKLVTDLVRRIKETVRGHKEENTNTNNKNIASTFEDNGAKEEEIKRYVRNELINFVRKFQLKICTESMDELEVELTDIVLDAMVAFQTGKEEKMKEEILFTLFDLLNITEYQANYFANNMISNMKKFYNDVPKIKSQTFIVLNTQTRGISARETIDENYTKTNLFWYTNQIIQQINEWISSFTGLDLNNNFTKGVIIDLAGDIVDRHKYLQLNPTTKISITDEIEHLKYQIFKSINKLVGDDNLETIEKAPELMKRIKSVPVSMLIKPQNNTQEYRQMGSGHYNRLCNNSKQANITFDCGKRLGRSNVTVAIGSVTQSKTLPSDSEEPNTANRMRDQIENTQPSCSTRNDRPQHNSNMPAEQKKQEQIIEEFDEFLKEWVQRIPISEKPELIEKCRLGIYNGIWKAISKIKMNPETLDNPNFYKDVLDDEIEELLNCLTQTPELKKQRTGLKAEVLDKAASINMSVAPATLNTSYKQQLVENISNNLPRTDNRVDHTGQDVNKLFEEVMKLHLAEYFILYTKYKEDDPIKANVFKKKLLKEVNELVDGIKQNYGKELRDIEIKQYVEGVVHALQKVPVPNNETVKLETDEIILALEVEQWFSDLPLMPNEERMDILSRRKYRDMLAKKLYDIENSSVGDNEEQMKEEITKFLKRMPFIPGQTENMSFMVQELLTRVKNRPRYDADDNNRNAVAFGEPHGYEAFSRDMPLCSSYTEHQNGSSYMIVGGERAADRSMAYGGQHVQGRNDPDSKHDWLSLGQSSAEGVIKGSPQGADPCCGRPTCSQHISPLPQSARNSQPEWLSLEQSADPEAVEGSPKGTASCCGRPTCSQSTSLPLQSASNSQRECLSTGQSCAQGAKKGSPESVGSCCGKPTCSQSTSLPPQCTLNTQREWLSLGPNSAQEAIRGSPQGSCCYGQSTRSQSISPPPLSQQDWRSLEQSKAPSAMRDNNFHQGSSSCCSKRATCPSQISTQSQTHSCLRIRDSTVASREQSPGNVSKVQSKTSNVSRRQSPSGDCNVCRGQSPDMKSEPATSKAKSKKSTKPPKVLCECFDTPNASKTNKSPSTGKASRGSSPASGSPNEDSKSVTSKRKLKKTKPPLKRESSVTNKSNKIPFAGKTSRGKSPASGSSDEDLKSVTSKSKLKKSKSPLKRESRLKTPNLSKTDKINNKPPTGKVSRGRLSASGSSDENLRSKTSKAKSKKSTKPPKVLCECFDTPNASKTNKSSSAGKISRGKSPASGSSGEESRSVTSKTNLRESKSPLKHGCGKANKSSQSPRACKVSRSKSSTSGASDEESEPKKDKSPRNFECDCADTPKSNKRTPNTTHAHSELPDSTRPVIGCSNDFPEDFSGRPAGYSTPNQGVPFPNMRRVKKGNRDIEQDKREAARRRIEIENSDDSDRDDVRCKCMERIWRWRQRQCKPCDGYPDFRPPFPMYPWPPYFN